MSQDVSSGRVVVEADPEAVAAFAAEFLVERAAATTGPFVVALSGGSTPKRLYAMLANDSYRDRFPWDRAHLFFGDERFVPPTDERSNYRMANDAMLSRVGIPSEAVHRVPTDGDPNEAAQRYARDLRGVYEARYGTDRLQPGKPLFDVVLLGLGENGHTASLFPRQPVLEERDAWVGTCVPDDAPDTRITLTYPAIRSSAAVLFLVTGGGKAPVVPKVRNKDPEQPASGIESEGELVWVLDREAAAEVRDE